MSYIVKNKKLLFSVMWIYITFSAYVSSVFYCESFSHILPASEITSLSFLSAKTPDGLTENEYDLIFRQTGLGREAVRGLTSLSELEEYQRSYFAEIKYDCIPNSPVSCEERVSEPAVRFAGLEDGDILITRSSHILSWRNGHAAIVTDAENGITLEAVVIGERSSYQKVSKWNGYPNFLVLRLKDASPELRGKIARTAEKLADKPYNAAVGIFPAKYREPDDIAGTQCAHLVWTAYAACGFDIDSDKGLIVTPRDIAGSPLLEIVQSYG